MRALRVESGRLLSTDVPEPEAGGEVLVRVAMSGICNTDLEIARGYMGFEGTLGHEFVGTDSSGRRVVGEINAGCGTCARCSSGDSRHCPTRTVLGIVGRDGCHAEFLRLPARNLVRVPDSVPDHQAVFVEPLAAACAILEAAPITPDSRVAVIGDGKLGNLCVQVLGSAHVPVLAIGKHPEKLRLLSCETVLANEAQKLGKRFDVVVEASGTRAGFGVALGLLEPRGTLILKSTFFGPTEVDAARIVIDEIRVVGSRCGRFAPALSLLASRSVRTDDLISEVLPLSDGLRAMERAAAPGVMKVLLGRPT